jgi:hypothetical protein
MREVIELVQGNTSDVKLTRPDFPDLPDALDENWVCQQAVMDCAGALVVGLSTVSDKALDEFDKQRFVVAVSPTDSATLSVAAGEPYQEYTWLIELSNTTTTPPYKKEHHITLRVYSQGIA